MESTQDVDMIGNDDYQDIDQLFKLKSPNLPISKVKKIAKCDPDYIITSNSAFVAVAFATEIFIKSLAEETIVLSQLNNTTNGQKVKRITYNDLAKSVQRHEKFQFLSDVIPMTKNLKTLVKQNKVRYTNVPPTADNQSVLPFVSANAHTQPKPDEVNSGDEVHDEEEELEEDEEEDDDDDDDDDDIEDIKDSEERSQMQKDLKEVEQLNHVEDLDKNDEYGSDSKNKDDEYNSDEEN